MKTVWLVLFRHFTSAPLAFWTEKSARDYILRTQSDAQVHETAICGPMPTMGIAK